MYLFQFKPIPVSLAPLVVNIAMATETWYLFNVDLTQLSVFMSDHTPCTHCSLRDNGLTDIGAIVLGRALEHNKSLEELK